MISRFRKNHIKPAVVAAGLLAVAALPSAPESASGPFAPLSNSWAGAESAMLYGRPE